MPMSGKPRQTTALTDSTSDTCIKHTNGEINMVLQYLHATSRDPTNMNIPTKYCMSPTITQFIDGTQLHTCH